MDESLKIYIAIIISLPLLVTFGVAILALVPEELLIVTYFLSLISTHLIVSTIQEKI